MAKCTLDLDHPYFQASIVAHENDLTFHEGLRALKAKVEAEHTSCNHVVQPMPGYPACQNKIWKYDWAPPDQRAARRKLWRMVVIVPEPSAKPFRLIAAQVYSKGSTDQLTNKRLAAILAAITVPTIIQSGSREAREAKFRRVEKSNGNTISICLDCGDTVIEAAVDNDIADAELLHPCQGPITA